MGLITPYPQSCLAKVRSVSAAQTHLFQPLLPTGLGSWVEREAETRDPHSASQLGQLLPNEK